MTYLIYFLLVLFLITEPLLFCIVAVVFAAIKLPLLGVVLVVGSALMWICVRVDNAGLEAERSIDAQFPEPAHLNVAASPAIALGRSQPVVNAEVIKDKDLLCAISLKESPSLVRYADSGIDFGRIAIVGLGGAGGDIVNRLIERGAFPIESCIAFDTDEQEISHSRAGKAIVLGNGISRGFSTGGSRHLALQIAKEEEKRWGDVLEPFSTIVFIAASGGGFGGGALPYFASHAEELGKTVLSIVVNPFDFERRSRNAAETLDSMEAKMVVWIENQKLMESEKTFSQGFDDRDATISNEIFRFLREEHSQGAR